MVVSRVILDLNGCFISHRDISFGNIMIHPTTRDIKVVDFECFAYYEESKGTFVGT